MNDDLISRQAAIDAINDLWDRETVDGIQTSTALKQVTADIKNLPSAQPEIVRCRECKFASGDSRICMKSGYSPIGELDFCAWAERKDNGND